ncbi:MAG: carboxypeptidase-like regulatory domain-containing protein [Crocinitomicaceae bacterium]|nr:carboxypeptidase-like regulatory domain-containing protein [Crocinitomicaceae bacterium]
MKRSLIFLFAFFISFNGFSQARVIGTVTDAATKEPLIGAYIILKKDPSIGAVSDIYGNYKLELTEGIHELVFKFTGMMNNTIIVELGKGEEETLNVEMQPCSLQKVDVIVGKFD